MRLSVGCLSVLVVACGGSSPTSGGNNNLPPGGVTVTMQEYAFAPDTVRISAGTTVRWTNQGNVDHTSTTDAPGGWNSGTIAPPHPQMTCPYPPCGNSPGGNFDTTFPTPGTYPYHCAFHEGLGMKGAVVVTP